MFGGSGEFFVGVVGDLPPCCVVSSMPAEGDVYVGRCVRMESWGGWCVEDGGHCVL